MASGWKKNEYLSYTEAKLHFAYKSKKMHDNANNRHKLITTH